MNAISAHDTENEVFLLQEGLVKNPLIGAFRKVLTRMRDFKERARAYYFEVVLLAYPCPQCGGRLEMTENSHCSCSCGKGLDPTLAFQKSPCCGARLVQNTYHYACSNCGKTVPSRFIFDERVFDRTYFRKMMRESRERVKRRKEEIKRLLAESRSEAIPFLREPNLESIPGLVQDLADFIRQDSIEEYWAPIDAQSDFSMEEYHKHIISSMGWSAMLFSDIVPLIADHRRDKVWRFITLIFMENDGLVELTQKGADIWVQKVYNEADS